MVDDERAAGAAWYVSTRIQRIRMEAAGRSANAAMQIVPSSGGFAFRLFVDGNGDGVRTEDINAGIDRPISAIERLQDNFAGVDFGVIAGLPPIDPGTAAPGSDPIKLGSSNLLSYAASGTSSSGSLYITGRSRAQYAVRVLATRDAPVCSSSTAARGNGSRYDDRGTRPARSRPDRR
jgi:hypothetical protein